jgi:hypothetical protein
MTDVLTTEQWRKARARADWAVVERKRARLVLLLLTILALVGLRWFGVLRDAPPLQ